MGSDRTGNTLLDGVGRARRPSHGRTTGPTRRSTKGQWTAEEDDILCMAVQRFQGKNWKKIAECFKDRTDVQCLHRWQKVLNPDLVKGPWSKEEDEIMIKLVNKYGPKKWSTISQHLPGRIGKQCRERWHNHLNPGINREAWTQDEELALIRAHQIYGNKWAELTKFLPGRSDNAIKNHWNSSVKKKLDTYLASGLLSQFEGQPLVSLSNHSVASSSSKAQQSSEDNRDGAEVEEASECSQGSNIACVSQPTNNTIPCFGDYRPAFQEVEYAMPEVPCELDDKFLGHDFSLDWVTFARKNWQLNTNDIPDMSLLDLGLDSFGLCMSPLTDTLNPIANSACERVNAEDGHDGFPSVNFTGDFDGGIDLLLHNCTNYQMPYGLSDMLGTSFCQPFPIPTQLQPVDGSLKFGINSDQYNCSEHVHAQQESILPTVSESDCLSHEDNSDEAKTSPKLVSANDFVLAPLNDSQCCSSKDNDSEKSDDQKDSGALFYEPPRFPSLDVPFFSCDLIQSGSDMHEEYSPLGIRQLTISSMTPFKLLDSPTRDYSPVAVLKSAAKSFTGTPSILKKRHRDLFSPLSEKRGLKKLDGSSKPESFSNLSNDITHLEVMFNECIDQKGNFEGRCTEKENAAPSCELAKNEDSEGILISEIRISQKEFNVSECSEKIEEEEQTCMKEVKTKALVKDAVDKAKDISGILVEHDINDLLFFSPDRYGFLGDRSIGVSGKALGNQYSSSIDAVSKYGAILSSSETSCFSVVCSPRFCKKDSSNLVITTSLQSVSPEKKVESFGKGIAFENNSIYVEVPFRRSMDSPSAWKSPWFMNTFVPGPRVDTDITIEDIGYYLSPGDQSYDAIGLMKQLGEQTASAFADAQEILGDETPQSLLKGKCSINQEADKENSCIPTFMTERRTLDFSECGSPRKETRKSLSSISFSSPSSYLLKGCR